MTSERDAKGRLDDAIREYLAATTPDDEHGHAPMLTAWSLVVEYVLPCTVNDQSGYRAIPALGQATSQSIGLLTLGLDYHRGLLGVER